MKTLIRFVHAVCVVLAVSLCACKSGDSHSRAESTAATMDQMGGVVAKARASAEAVGKSLRSVVDTADSDPAPAFAQFKRDLESMKSSRDDLYARDRSVQSQGRAYLAEWEKSNATIEDAELKETAEERRMKLQEALASLEKPMGALRAGLDPVLSSLEDLRKVLAADLTPAGIDAVASKAKSARSRAADLEELFDDLDSALKKVAPQFKLAKPPTAAAK